MRNWRWRRLAMPLGGVGLGCGLVAACSSGGSGVGFDALDGAVIDGASNADGGTRRDGGGTIPPGDAGATRDAGTDTGPVNPGDLPSFTLRADPSSVTIANGASEELVVHVEPASAFSRPVSLRVAPEDGPGFKMPIASASVTGATPASTTVHLQVAREVEPGSYPVRIQGFVGEGIVRAETTVTVTVDRTGVDPSFGVGGKVIVDLGGMNQRIYAMKLQPDGKIVAGVRLARGGKTGFDVLRLLPDGTRDPAFGVDGVVALPLDGAALALQSDGKIIAAGASITAGTIGGFSAFRLDAAGALDPTFGDGGRKEILVEQGELGANDVAIDAAGRILLAGTVRVSARPTIAVARLTPGGQLDDSFDGDGRRAYVRPSSAGALCIALDESGQVLLGGYDGDFDGTGSSLIQRNLGEGALDPTFGDAGIALVPGPMLSRIRLQPDGKIVVLLGGPPNSVRRHISTGPLDPTFGDAGTIEPPALPEGKGLIRDLVPLADGRLVAFGGRGGASTAKQDMAVFRFLPSGAPDTTFYGIGALVIPMSPASVTDFGNDEAAVGLVQPDGKYVLGGSATRNIALTRVLP